MVVHSARGHVCRCRQAHRTYLRVPMRAEKPPARHHQRTGRREASLLLASADYHNRVMLVGPADLDSLLRRHQFSRRLGLKVVELGDGTCTVRVPFRRTFERPGGIVSGDVYMTAADIAFWLAIKTFAGLDDPSVTSHLNTTFLSAARGEPFLCLARVLRRGRQVTYGVAECTSGERILTHHTLTYMRPS